MNETWKKILIPLIGLLSILMMTSTVYARPAKITKLYGSWNNIGWKQPPGMNGSNEYNYRIYNWKGKIVKKGITYKKPTNGTINMTLSLHYTDPVHGFDVTGYVYGFDVRGKSGKSYGPWSTIKWVVPQPDYYMGYYTQTDSGLKITIRWNPIAGAYKGYRVYWSRHLDSGYRFLGTTKRNSWTKSLSKGYHYFIIQPVFNSSAASKKNIRYKIYQRY